MKYSFFVLLFALLVSQRGYSITDTTKLHSYDTTVKALTAQYKSGGLNFQTAGREPGQKKLSIINIRKDRMGKLVFDSLLTKRLKAYIKTLNLSPADSSLLLTQLKNITVDSKLVYKIIPILKESGIDTNNPINVIDTLSPEVPKDDLIQSNKRDNLWIYLLFSFLTIVTVMFFVFKIKNLKKQTKEINENQVLQEGIKKLREEFGVDTNDIDFPILVNSVIKKFKGIKESKKEIDGKYTTLENTNFGLSKSIIEKDKIITEKEKKSGEDDKEIERIKSELETRNTELTEYENQLGRFKFLTGEIIQKYYKPYEDLITSGSIPDNPTQIKKTIECVFQIAFHCVSFLKQDTANQSDFDLLNVKLLEGKPVSPDKVVHLNMPTDEIKPIALIVLLILKKLEIENLEGVFVQGQQLGK